MILAGIPSRGLIYSKTVESLLANKPDDIYIVTGQPIPDCFNELADYALKLDADLWIVEEDIRLPSGTRTLLEESSADIVTANYKLEGGGDVVREHGSGYIYGGTGCTLIRNHVLKKLGHFRTDTEWNAKTLDSWTTTKKRVYGKHDVDYYLRAQIEGFTIEVIGLEVGHMRMDKRGDERTNEGWHRIIELT